MKRELYLPRHASSLAAAIIAVALISGCGTRSFKFKVVDARDGTPIRKATCEEFCWLGHLNPRGEFWHFSGPETSADGNAVFEDWWAHLHFVLSFKKPGFANSDVIWSPVEPMQVQYYSTAGDNAGKLVTAPLGGTILVKMYPGTTDDPHGTKMPRDVRELLETKLPR